MTRGGYAKRLADALNVPWTLHNRRGFQAWVQAEVGSDGSSGARFNPWNTTEAMPGATNFNSIGVKNYVSPEQGIEAMVRTFRGDGHGYEKILRLMRDNAPAEQTLKAIGESDWGTAGTLGVAVLDDIRRHPEYLRTLERKEVAG